MMYANKNRENFEREWNNLFGKHFQLSPFYEENSECGLDQFDPATAGSTSCTSPSRDENCAGLDASNTFDDSLEWLKTELNLTKSLLNDYDIAVWRNHTNFTNLCSNLSRFLKKEINAELCTQAWLKFVTIINTYDLLPLKSCNRNETFLSLHSCEAPGAFITCLNHHLLHKHSALKWNWIATTLNPYYDGNSMDTMINDDRFIRETLENWEFGTDFSGNIMDIENLTKLKERCACLGDINMVTADGSIDCSFDPCQQEVMVSPLIYWEVVTALNILSFGGNFVIKVFTVLEKFTISLIYLLCRAFEEVHFCKPGPSKAGNSEVYIVCKCYHGQERLGSDFMEMCMRNTMNKNYIEPLVPIDAIPETFLKRILDCQEFYISRQIDAIKKNIKSFENISKGKAKFIYSAKNYICQNFVTEFNLEKIDSMDHIGYSKEKSQSRVGNNYTKDHSHQFTVGSFHERKLKKRISWSTKMKSDDEDLEHKKSGELQWYISPEKQPNIEEILKFKPIQGKQFLTCKNTQFCSNYLMMDLYEARSKIFPIKTEPKVSSSTCSMQSPVCNEFQELDKLLNLQQLTKIAVLDNSADPDMFTLEIQKNQSLPYSHTDKTDTYTDSTEKPQSSISSLMTLSSTLRNITTNVRPSQNFNGSNSGNGAANTDERYSGDLTQSECTKSGSENAEMEIKCAKQQYEQLMLPKAMIVEERGTLLNEKVDGVICSALLDKQTVDQESSHEQLLINLIATFKVLRRDGVLICKAGDLFSNFNAGIVYIMSRIFEKMMIFKPMSSFQLFNRYVVCSGFKGENQAVTDYLQSVYKMQTNANDLGQFQIIHIVPIRNILEETFLAYLKDVNEMHVSAEIKLINKNSEQMS